MPETVNNVVFLVVDALRADRVGAYSGDTLTPTIDSIAENGEVFERCFSCVNATDSSLTTMFTGKYPTHHGVLNQGDGVTEQEQRFASGSTSIASVISDTHETIGVDWMGRWHKRGFDTYGVGSKSETTTKRAGRTLVNSLPDILSSPMKSMYRSLFANEYVSYVEAEQVTDFALKNVSSTDEPWFLFAHYWDSHLPYVPPEKHPPNVRSRTYDDGDEDLANLFELIEGSEWHELLTDEFLRELHTVGELKQRYDAGVSIVDSQIQRIVNYLKSAGIYDETAIIITGDHGESLTEHGIFFDHHGLYDTTVHVPLVIDAPGFEGREASFVQHFDLAPTLVELVGNDIAFDSDGTSLVPDSNGQRSLDRDAVFMEEGHASRQRAIRTDSYKYIVNLNDNEVCRYCEVSHGSVEELYELSADENEQHNLIDEEPERAAALAERLDDWVSSIDSPVSGDIKNAESDQAMERLDDLGYI